MSEFTEREKAFEKKFELDEEIHFRIASRAAKGLGQWAAEKLGLKGPDAEAYGHTALDADLTTARHSALVGKIEVDFKAKNIPLTRAHIARELEAQIHQARETILGTT